MFNALEYHLQLWPSPPKKEDSRIRLIQTKTPVMTMSRFLMGRDETDFRKELLAGDQRKDLYSHQPWERGVANGSSPQEI